MSTRQPNLPNNPGGGTEPPGNGGGGYTGNPGYNGGGGVGPPSGQSTNPGGSAGLLTSTGGLFGINGVLLTPVFNYVTGKSYFLLMDPSNFNCEENAEYDFPQYIPQGHDGEDVTCHLVILKYREIGYAKLSINITSYQRLTDKFITNQYPVTIPPIPLTAARKKTFPDKKIHTLYIPIDDVGERPQPTVTSNGGSGAYSIISLILCGNADQTKQM